MCVEYIWEEFFKVIKRLGDEEVFILKLMRIECL